MRVAVVCQVLCHGSILGLFLATTHSEPPLFGRFPLGQCSACLSFQGTLPGENQSAQLVGLSGSGSLWQFQTSRFKTVLVAKVLRFRFLRKILARIPEHQFVSSTLPIAILAKPEVFPFATTLVNHRHFRVTTRVVVTILAVRTILLIHFQSNLCTKPLQHSHGLPSDVCLALQPLHQYGRSSKSNIDWLRIIRPHR